MESSRKVPGTTNFEIEVKNISVTNSNNILHNEKVPIILNWIGRRGTTFMRTLNG